MRLTPIAAAMALVLAFAGTALAQAAYSFEEQQACTADAFRLCSKVIPDIPKVRLCMEAARSQLSPACAAMFEPGRDRRLNVPGAGPPPQ